MISCSSADKRRRCLALDVHIDSRVSRKIQEKKQKRMWLASLLVVSSPGSSSLPHDGVVTRGELEALTQRIDHLAEQLASTSRRVRYISSAVEHIKSGGQQISGPSESTKPRAKSVVRTAAANLSVCPEGYNATALQTTASFTPLCGGPETLASIQCGSMPCTNFQRAWFVRTQLVAERIANASSASPVRSMSELRARCDGNGGRGRLMKHVRPLLLRVPKAASTLVLHSVAQACNASGHNPTALWDHQAPPINSCKEVGIATLREPCDRIVSIYRHLLEKYTPAPPAAHCLISRAAGHTCRRHWVHQAETVDAFVGLLRQRWATVLGHPALTLIHHRANTMDLFGKHITVAVPQAIYLSNNFTVVLCARGSGDGMPSGSVGLRADLAELQRDLKCHGGSSILSDGVGERVVNVMQGGVSAPLLIDAGGRVNAAKTSEAGGEPPGKFVLSAAGCKATRELYSVDASLWQRVCAAPLA